MGSQNRRIPASFFVNHALQITQWEFPSSPGPSSPCPAPGPSTALVPSAFNSAPVAKSSAAGSYCPPTPGALNAADEETGELIHAEPEEMDHEAISRRFGVCSAIVDTIGNNILLCFICVGLWTLLPLLAISQAEAVKGFFLDKHSKNYPIFLGVTGVFAAAYVFLFVLPARFINMKRSSGSFLTDKPLESLKDGSKSTLSAVRKYIDGLNASPPAITLKVECWRPVKGKYSNRYLKLKTTQVTKKVSYTAKVKVAVTNWRDTSVDRTDFLDALARRGGEYISLSYDTVYKVTPDEEASIERMREAYEETHSHLDTFCNVTVEYNTAAFQTGRVDNVVCNGHQDDDSTCAKLFLNNIAFYLFIWLTFYPIYIVIWKLCITPVVYHNVKHLEVDMDLDLVQKPPPVKEKKKTTVKR
jgi:hypothetical protein